MLLFFFFFFCDVFLANKNVFFDRIAKCLRNPGSITTNNFDKDLIIARTRNALRMWIGLSFHCDIASDPTLMRKVESSFLCSFCFFCRLILLGKGD
jgi:hypothetical protein